jgi:hypothetical protein
VRLLQVVEHSWGASQPRLFISYRSSDQQRETVDQMVASNWRSKQVLPLAIGLPITFAVSLAVYGLIRAIGWVFDGFMAS